MRRIILNQHLRAAWAALSLCLLSSPAFADKKLDKPLPHPQQVAPPLPMGIAVPASGNKSSGPVRAGTSFLFPDGTRVRAADPSGHEGKVQSDGSIKYADGLRVSHDPVSGESKLIDKDGSVTRVNPSDPRRSGDSYVFGDGVRARAVDPNGKAGEVQGNGSIRYSDGTVLSHDVRSGDTKIVHADGSVEVTSPNSPHRDGNYFVWSDGQRAVSTSPSGAAGKVDASGTVTFPDGTSISHDVRSGDSKIVHADGSVDVTHGNVPQQTGDYFTWSDGQRAPARDPSGNAGKAGGDGWIVYSDGSMVSHDPVSGDSKIVHSDGSLTMGNSRTGETKEFDPAQERGLQPPGSGKDTKPAGGGTSTGNPGANSTSKPESKPDNSSKPDKSNDKPEKGEKPEKEPVDKGGKGRQVADDGAPSGGKAPGLRLGSLNLTGQPAPDASSSGSGAKSSPTHVTGGVGPGARPGDGGVGTAGGSRLRFAGRDLVINPNPVGMSGGGGAHKPIDPYGGRR